MLRTRIIEDCYEYRLDAETTEYRLEFSAVEKGELPHTQIFVYTIVVENNPSSDVFARVASVGDLKSYANKTRNDMIATGGTEYLSSSMSITYPLLNVATQAKQVLTTRINECINNWLAYRDAFYDDGSTPVPFPTVDEAYEQALINAYVSARDARIAAEADVTATETALALAEKDADHAEAILTIYEAEAAFCQRARITDWNVLSPLITAFKNGSQTQLSAMKTTFVALANVEHPSVPFTNWPPDGPTLIALGTQWQYWYNEMAAPTTGWESLINTYSTSGDPLASDLTAAFTSFCQGANASVISQTNVKTLADAAVTTAVQAKQEAEAALASASAAEAAALAAVKNICPDFDPSSV